MEGHIALIFVVSSRWVNHIVRISDYASRWVYLQLWVRHACGCNLRWASMQACSRVPTLWIKILLPYLSAHSSSLSVPLYTSVCQQKKPIFPTCKSRIWNSWNVDWHNFSLCFEKIVLRQKSEIFVSQQHVEERVKHWKYLWLMTPQGIFVKNPPQSFQKWS